MDDQKPEKRSLAQIIQDLKNNFKQSLDKYADAISEKELEQLRIDWLGKKSKTVLLYKQLAKTPESQRAELGKLINNLKSDIESSITKLAKKLVDSKINNICSKPPLDFSLPSSSFYQSGNLHPVTLASKKLYEIFTRLGYSIKDGPHIENDYFNFASLNIPQNHPARDMQDTFYLKNNKNPKNANNPFWLLRSQTSNIQIHTMLSKKPPIKIIAPGKVFRMDYDQTHTPMFHQIEGLMVDQDISMSDLKGTIICFLDEFFEGKAQIRLRPSYFPFVEPGAEIDIKLKNHSNKNSVSDWLEVGGCGMVHPNVFESVDYDSQHYTGFAFGFGIDRLAMLKFGINDLRKMFLGDKNFQSQFCIYHL